MTTPRIVRSVHAGSHPHWVGDGFRVSNYISPGTEVGDNLSPFILMDYHAPHAYPPSAQARGVGPHPHRGFETVSIAWEGSVAHHDSTGNAGVIGPGDVQWMTAGSGILHKEYHEAGFARRGGTMHMMQLWVNLPRAHKMDPPGYQPLLAEQMGRVELPDGAGVVSVIAGAFRGVPGPARTFSPINLWDVHLNAGGHVDVSFPAEENLAFLVAAGAVTVNGRAVPAGHLVLFANEGEDVHVEATAAAHLLVLNGAPLNEPVVQYGPFVMSTTQEIRQAIDDFNSGKFGQLA